MKNKDATYERLIQEATDLLNKELDEQHKLINESRQALEDGTHPSINYKEYAMVLDTKEKALDKQIDANIVEKVLDFQYSLICDAITNLEDIAVPSMGTFKVFGWLRKIYDSKVEKEGDAVSIKELYINEKMKRHPDRQYGKKLEEARKSGSLRVTKGGLIKPKLKRLF